VETIAPFAALLLVQVLQEALPVLLQRVQPELVLYNAGVDVHKDDALGQLALSDEGIARRDRAVFSACAEFGVPIACAIGGGYQEDHTHIVRRHMHLHRAAAEHMPAFGRLMDAKRAAAAARRRQMADQQQLSPQQQSL
jgi:acetoin utilization deacetylase AcuC-like enzyme